MWQLIANSILSTAIFMPLVYVINPLRFVLLGWLATRIVFYILDPRFAWIQSLFYWRFRNRSYLQQISSVVDFHDDTYACITQPYTIVCGDTAFPSAALAIALVAKYCGDVMWTRIRVPANYFGDGTFESQILRIVGCEPLEFYEPLEAGDIVFMARTDLSAHATIVKRLRTPQTMAYHAVQCQAILPIMPIGSIVHGLDSIDDAIFEWQSPHLLAGLYHIISMYTLSTKPLRFETLVAK